MQSHHFAPPSQHHHDCLGTSDPRRQVPINSPYNSSSYGHGDYHSSNNYASAQQSRSGNFTYVNTSPTAAYNASDVSDRSNGWPSSLPSPAVPRSHNYGHMSSNYGVSGLPALRTPPMNCTSYESAPRHSTSLPYSGSAAGSDRYRGAPNASAPFSGYSYHPASFNHAPPSMHAAQPSAQNEALCMWRDKHCGVPIEDTSPSGIARHLKSHHDINVTDNRTRGACLWGGRCGKDMFPSSYGKHIAECHLRNMTKQCPHCGADFARADTLSRHIKAFCPNTAQSYSSN